MSGLATPWPLVVGIALAALGAVATIVAVRMVSVWRKAATGAERDLAEAYAIKNDFVAMVSHELRTPLTSIHGYSQVLEESWRDLPPEEIDEFLAQITRQSWHLHELVDDVLTIPRLQAGRLTLHPEVFDLSEVIHEAAGVVFPGGEVSVSIPGGVRAWGDPRRTHQVMRNLLENARKYGGTQVLVEGFPAGDHFVVVVSDNGPGIPAEAAGTIFEHFEQLSKGDARSSSGVGLGLPIARRLARAMGGDVWHERRFPTGSRFCFSITTTPEALERVMTERETAGTHERQAVRPGP